MYLYFKFLLYLTIFITSVYSQCGKEDGFYPHPSQCDAYIYCVNGKQTEEGLCPDGLVFNQYGNPAFKRCVLPFDIDCSDRPALQEPKPSGDCPRQNGIFPIADDCSRFLECGNGISHVKQCGKGLAWNKNSGNCDWPENGDCAPEDLVGFTCPEASPAEIAYFGHPRYPHPNDCRLLFACVAPLNQPFTQRSPRLLGCDEGFVYNPESGVCDYPENVKGCENYYSPITTSSGYSSGSSRFGSTYYSSSNSGRSRGTSYTSSSGRLGGTSYTSGSSERSRGTSYTSRISGTSRFGGSYTTETTRSPPRLIFRSRLSK